MTSRTSAHTARAAVMFLTTVAGERFFGKKFSRNTSLALTYSVPAALYHLNNDQAPSRNASWSLRPAVLAAAVSCLYVPLVLLTKPKASNGKMLPTILALGMVTPVGEELLWVQPNSSLGESVLATGLWVLKHPMVDGNWKRVPALVAAGVSFEILRRNYSPAVATAGHVGINVSGVLMGRIMGKDLF